MAANRQRILEEAGRLFREKGFEAVSVAEVMKAAGLTHGGFYGHFESKDDLIAQALDHAIGTRSGDMPDLWVFIDEYLTLRHRDNAAGGCAIAGLAADTLRQTQQARTAVTGGVRDQIEWIGERLSGQDHTDTRRIAIAAWSAMVGATILSRAAKESDLSEEILSETRAWLHDVLEQPPAET